MKDKRLNQASDRIVNAVEDEARERGIDVTLASNLAVDTSLQDDVLCDLCQTLDRLDRIQETTRHDDAVGKETADSTLAAGINLQDAVDSRVEMLIEEIIDEAERQQIEEGLTA